MEENITLIEYTRKLFYGFLVDKKITEIVVNGREVFFLFENEWVQNNNVNINDAKAFIQALASKNNDYIDETKPILSGTLESGERVQVAIAPVVDNFSITIRKPSKLIIKIDDLRDDFFNTNLTNAKDFLKTIVTKKLNIVIAGATGSGKTTLINSLINEIENERLITIEDTRELKIIKNQNNVHLLYPSEAKTGDIITASSLLKCCMRMKPDRILLSEIRGGEAFEFIKLINSGHNGCITSVHASSPEGVINQLSNYVLSSNEGRNIPYEIIQNQIRQAIDVIIIMENRKITQIKEVKEL